MHDSLAPLLAKIVSDRDLHGRLLNTLSFLEYIGFRKIVKSQEATTIDVEILSHAVEEGRHALMLKKLAIKAGGEQFSHYSDATLLCGDAAEAYFQKLDKGCEAICQKDTGTTSAARLTYLYVTWLVEVRALSVYGLYQEALAAAGEKLPLHGLLAEEDRHLEAVEQGLLALDPKFSERMALAQQLEEKLYSDYLSALVQELDKQQVQFARSVQ